MNRSVKSIHPPHWAEVVPGSRLSRPFPQPGLRFVDPFLLLDHGPPRTLEPGEKIHVPPHPHRGFSPVSLAFNGEFEHRDSMGNHSTVGSGGVQWMTAASGVVHEEIMRPENGEEGGLLHAMQLWVNLPASKKYDEPSYQNVQADAIPIVSLDQGRTEARIIAGNVFDHDGPVDASSPLLIVRLQMEAGSDVSIPLPRSFNTLVYVLEGAVDVGDDVVESLHLVQYENDGDQLFLSAPSANHLLVLAGEPLAEPVVFGGPFVMNSEEEIQQAYEDYRMGRMGELAPA